MPFNLGVFAYLGEPPKGPEFIGVCLSSLRIVLHGFRTSRGLSADSPRTQIGSTPLPRSAEDLSLRLSQLGVDATVVRLPSELSDQLSTPGRHGDSEVFVFVLVKAEVCGCEPVERRKRFEKVGLVEARVFF